MALHRPSLFQEKTFAISLRINANLTEFRFYVDVLPRIIYPAQFNSALFTRSICQVGGCEICRRKVHLHPRLVKIEIGVKKHAKYEPVDAVQLQTYTSNVYGVFD